MSWSEALWAAVLVLGALSSPATTPRSHAARLTPAGRCVAGMIEDPTTSQRWCIVRNENHPAWPPRLIMIPYEAPSLGLAVLSPAMRNSQSAKSRRNPETIRVNDVLSISEETASLQASFEGIAVSGGGEGDVILVRLRFGGRVIRAQVMAPGRARLIPDSSETFR